MSTVDDAVEAARRASNLWEHPDMLRVELRAAWPILSAPLRNLHHPEPYAQGPDYCAGCEHRWPCPTEQWRRETDKELGLT